VEVIKKIKDGKAVGVDGVPGKVWKYGRGEKVLDWIVEFCNRVWKEEEWSEEWKEEVIMPKKGEGRKMEEYRGVILMSTLAQDLSNGVSRKNKNGM